MNLTKVICNGIFILAVIFGAIFFAGDSFSRVGSGAGLAAADRDLIALTECLEFYQTNAGAYPSQEQGLGVLLERPVTAPLPERWVQLRREMPVDPWGNAYRYLFPGKQNPDQPEIISAGPDRIFDTEDDLSNQD